MDTSTSTACHHVMATRKESVAIVFGLALPVNGDGKNDSQLDGGISFGGEEHFPKNFFQRRGRNFKFRLHLKKVQCSFLIKSTSGFPPFNDAGFRILRETIFPTKQQSLNDTCFGTNINISPSVTTT